MLLGHLKSRNLKSQRGFSLVEMISVTLMIGTLGAIATPKFLKMKAKTFQMEAHTNVRVAELLVAAYVVDNGNAFLHTDCAVWVAGGYCRFTDSTSAGCNKANPAGFSVTNCAEARFYYYYYPGGTASNPGTLNEYYVEAFNKDAILPGCTAGNNIRVFRNSCGKICDERWITDVNTCGIGSLVCGGTRHLCP